MGAVIFHVISWPTLGCALLVWGFAPGAVLRLIVLLYPRDHPRRRELIGELHAHPRIERPFWVAEQLETALFGGLYPRIARHLHRLTASSSQPQTTEVSAASLASSPQNVYRHLQAGFAESNAQRCVEYEDNRIFHPGDAFIDVLRWLWGGIEGGPVTVAAISGESLACTLLADHFAAVNAILAEQEPPAAPMTIDEMITGLGVAGLGRYVGPAEYQRICAMIREDVPAMTGYTAEGKLAHLIVPRQEPPAGTSDASVPVTYSGKPREDQDDVETWLGQVTITEPGDSRRTFTHYPEHPDDPDHRALTWGYTGSGPLATGALILNDALGFGTPGTIDHAGVMPGGVPSPMLVAFTEYIVAKFPDQRGRASWQLSRRAVLEWVSKWRAENDANGEARPET
jgi:hypothetical protein